MFSTSVLWYKHLVYQYDNKPSLSWTHVYDAVMQIYTQTFASGNVYHPTKEIK